jgi:hypothetical protein
MGSTRGSIPVSTAPRASSPVNPLVNDTSA